MYVCKAFSKVFFVVGASLQRKREDKGGQHGTGKGGRACCRRLQTGVSEVSANNASLQPHRRRIDRSSSPFKGDYHHDARPDDHVSVAIEGERAMSRPLPHFII